MAIPVAPKKHPYNQWCPDARALDLVGDKWTLLIVRDLIDRPVRFVDLQRRLPGISTEQLRSRLNRMVADGLLTRQRYREVPPRVDYELTAEGRALVPVIGAVAEWGRAFAWGEPRKGETFSLDAVWRLVPALVRPTKAVRGTVALSGDNDACTVTISRGSVSVEQGWIADADAHVEGADCDWILALSHGDRSELKINGNESLAHVVIDGLVGSASIAELRSKAAA